MSCPISAFICGTKIDVIFFVYTCQAKMVVHSIDVVYGSIITHDEAIKLFADDFKCYCDSKSDPLFPCNCMNDYVDDLMGESIAGELHCYPFPHDDCPRIYPESFPESYHYESLYVLGIEVADFYTDGLIGNKPQSGTALSEIIAADAKFTKELFDSKFGVFLASRSQGVDAKLLLIKGDCHCCS